MQTLKSITRSGAYGWVMVVVAALAMVATLPGRSHGLSMISERLILDPSFSMTRIEYADLNLWGTLFGGLFCLPCGWLIDRYGLRINLTVIVAALGMVVLWMTRLESRAELFVAILLTRGFGQSALSVVSITIVGKWFRKGATLPMAVFSVILSLGFGGAAQWAKPYNKADWRTVWEAIGWLLVGVMLPVALLLTRNPVKDNTAPQLESQSAEPGAEPDASGNANGHKAVGFTLPQAMQTPAFWAFGLAISHMAVVTSGLSLFNQSILQMQGFSTETFYNLLTFGSVVGLIFQVPVGWLGRFVPPGRLQAVGLVLQSSCMLSLPYIHTESQLAVYAIGMGLGGSISAILFYSIWGQAFGQPHLGNIQGFSQMLTVLASSFGPKLLAECLERTGDYRLAFQILAVAGFSLAAGTWFVVVPRPEDATRFHASTSSQTSAENLPS